MALFGQRKKESCKLPEDCIGLTVDVDKSICTGEMTVGFRDPQSGKLKLAELVRSEADIAAYKKKYGL